MILRRYFSKSSYDLAVIGGGPGGYVASIKASQLGLKTVCIDSQSSLGGTCLNTGCIPSKTLLKITKKYSELQSISRFGLSCQNPTFNWEEIQKIKSSTIKSLSDGIKYLFKKNNIDFINGSASFLNPSQLLINQEKDQPLQISASNYLIATGSKVKPLKNFEIDEKTFFSSTGVLSLKTIPKKMIVIGAGVIGIELGSVYRALGTEVVFIEYDDRICPSMDIDVSKEYSKYLQKDGFVIHLNSACLKGEVDPKTNKAIVHFQTKGQDSSTIITADICLIAVGRIPQTSGLKLDNLNVSMSQNGKILVNNRLQTNHQHIFAIGDVIEGPMLAHKAEEEGIAIAEFLSGKNFHLDYDSIPNVIYTDPEIASIGKTQQELIKLGIPFKIGTFPMNANSRTKSSMETKPGFVKILAHRDTDRILGGHIICKNAGEMIHELALAMQMKASSEDISRMSHAHPTLSEGIKEAAMSINSKAIHF